LDVRFGISLVLTVCLCLALVRLMLLGVIWVTRRCSPARAVVYVSAEDLVRLILRGAFWSGLFAGLLWLSVVLPQS